MATNSPLSKPWMAYIMNREVRSRKKERKKEKERRYLRTTLVPSADKVQEEGIIDGIFSEQEAEIDLLLFRKRLLGRIRTGNTRVLIRRCASLDRLWTRDFPRHSRELGDDCVCEYVRTCTVSPFDV